MAKKVRMVRPEGMELVQETKEDLITKLSDARQVILGQVAALSPVEQDEVFLGEWSVKDLLVHLIGWDITYVAAVQDLTAGELPSFYSAYDADWATYNRNLVREYKRDDWSKLLVAVRDSHDKLMSTLQAIPEEDYERDFGARYAGTSVTIARLVQAEIKDEREHSKQIREWIG